MNKLLVTPYNVGRFCLSENECIRQGLSFTSYEKGVSDAADAFGNDRLLNAATDLLEALQELFAAEMEHVLMGDGKDDQVAAIAKARAAITKATGGAA